MVNIVGHQSLNKRLSCWTAWTLATGALLCAASTMIGPWNGVADMVAAFLPFALAFALASVAVSIFVRPFRGLVWLWLTAFAAAAIASWHIAPEMTWDETRPQSGRPVVIVTHNMHHGGASPERLVAVLSESGADILLLQENDRRSARALDTLARLYPYRDSCRACEQAILSRWPMEVHWQLPDQRGKPTGPPLFRADVHVPGVSAPLRVISLHAPRPVPQPGQKIFFQGLTDGLRHSKPGLTVLAGDLNLPPWTATMARLQRDVAPMQRITRGQFSYPASIAGFTWPVLPIDHMFVTPDIAVGSVGRLDPTGSDHLGIRATLWVSHN